jgi:hypothetical protein
MDLIFNAKDAMIFAKCAKKSTKQSFANSVDSLGALRYMDLIFNAKDAMIFAKGAMI